MTTDRERWNARHSAHLDEAPRGPAEWLVACADRLPARGRALDVACGLGRNALWLADHGFSVDAVDVSDVAVEELARRAAGLPVRTFRLDLSVDPLPAAGYDVVVVIAFLDRDLLPRLAAALAPGGVLLVDTFVADPDCEDGPRNPAYVLERSELPALVPGLEVLELVEGRPEPHVHAHARMLARRPFMHPVRV